MGVWVWQFVIYRLPHTDMRTHIATHMYIYIYIYKENELGMIQSENIFKRSYKSPVDQTFAWREK